MTIDIRELLGGQTNIIPFDFELPLDTEGCPDDITITAPVHVVGNITNQAGFMQLSLTADVPAQASCARCLACIDASFSLNFVKVVAETEDLENPDNDDYLIVDDGQLDIVSPLSDQIWLELPTRFLCKPDCKGLCPVCGKDRNLEDCGCDTRIRDSRLEVLRKLIEEK
ncbi:MAG: DUF177 domain-containing protein [Ruminococcaceae bacterium]|nr:DUF177 domain-containing protein [Oscillospiraceae bacterium]